MRPTINLDFGAELMTPPPSPGLRIDARGAFLPSPTQSYGDLKGAGEPKGYMTPRAAYLKRLGSSKETSMDRARRLTPRTAHLRHLASGLSGGFTYLVDKVMSPKASAPARIRTTRHGDVDASMEHLSDRNSDSSGCGIQTLPPLLKLIFIVICACVVLGGGRMLGIAIRDKRSVRQRRWPHAELGDDAHGLYLNRPAVEKVPVVTARPPPPAAAAAASEIDKHPPLHVAGVNHHNEAATSAARAASDMAKVVTRVQKQMEQVRRIARRTDARALVDIDTHTHEQAHTFTSLRYYHCA